MGKRGSLRDVVDGVVVMVVLLVGAWAVVQFVMVPIAALLSDRPAERCAYFTCKGEREP